MLGQSIAYRNRRGNATSPHYFLFLHQICKRGSVHCVKEIRRIQQGARKSGSTVKRLRWPMVILRSLKGWTGPKEVDRHKVEGYRFTLTIDAIDRVPSLKVRGSHAREALVNQQLDCRNYAY